MSNCKGGQETKKGWNKFGGKGGQEKKGTIKEVRDPPQKKLKAKSLVVECKKHSRVNQTIIFIHPHRALTNMLSNYAWLILDHAHTFKDIYLDYNLLECLKSIVHYIFWVIFGTTYHIRHMLNL